MRLDRYTFSREYDIEEFDEFIKFKNELFHNYINRKIYKRNVTYELIFVLITIIMNSISYGLLIYACLNFIDNSSPADKTASLIDKINFGKKIINWFNIYLMIGGSLYFFILLPISTIYYFFLTTDYKPVYPKDKYSKYLRHDFRYDYNRILMQTMVLTEHIDQDELEEIFDYVMLSSRTDTLDIPLYNLRWFYDEDWYTWDSIYCDKFKDITSSVNICKTKLKWIMLMLTSLKNCDFKKTFVIDEKLSEQKYKNNKIPKHNWIFQKEWKPCDGTIFTVICYGIIAVTLTSIY